jgi:DNA-binding transcriptional MerR regulator
MRGGVAEHHLDRRTTTRDALARRRHEGRRDVDRDDPRVAAERVGRGERDRPAAAPDVEDLPRADVGELVRASGLPASTLHYYEERGLTRPTARRGLRRQYAAGVLDRLAVVALGRVAGFSLDEIGAMLGDDAVRIDRPALLARADAVDATIHRLEAVRDGLRHVAACPAPRHVDRPTFRGLLDDALRGALPSPARGAGLRRARPGRSGSP